MFALLILYYIFTVHFLSVSCISNFLLDVFRVSIKNRSWSYFVQNILKVLSSEKDSAKIRLVL
jgi:hypothetical protein